MDYRNITRSKETSNNDGTVTWTETMTSPGRVHTRTVTAESWHVEITDCFCCSCSEGGSFDPHCRNHGWVGSRPCETHKRPGIADDDGTMPTSVQRILADTIDRLSR